MSFLLESLRAAFGLIVEADPELLAIVWFSLKISMISTFCAALPGIPLAFAIYLNRFRLRKAAITLLNSLLALPTVVIALLVYSFLSRRGLLGSFDLLYSQTAIIIGQVILVIPMAATFTLSALGQLDIRYLRTARSLGATKFQIFLVLLKENRFALAAVIAACFGRVIAEIGISMMLGGNIKGFTRTMTTAMALEYDKGEFTLAVALGIILMTITLGVNIVIAHYQGNLHEKYNSNAL
ncbi:MAG: ABC transporter permease [Candidatus Rifleibacteriota bacterium]